MEAPMSFGERHVTWFKPITTNNKLA